MPVPAIETLGAPVARRERRPSLRVGDTGFRWASFAAALCVLSLVVLAAQQLIFGSIPIFREQGLAFLVSRRWDVERDVYGALPFAWATAATSMIALLLGGSVAVAVSAFLVALGPRFLLKPVGILVDMLAAIPSIIYGFWAILVLVPWLRASVYPDLTRSLGWTGLFGTPDQAIPGTGLLTAGLVLAIMIVPTVAAVSREVLLVVPTAMRDGALALGANRTEALRTVELPYAASGILGALILGLGRALGETMAVTMVIGNSPTLSANLLRPAASLSSAIATQFGEAGGLQRSALIGLGLVLFVITIVMNGFARLLVYRVARRSGVQAR